MNLTRALRDEYRRLFDTCQTRPEKNAVIDGLVTSLVGNKARYRNVGDPLGIPWYFIAVIHNMESSQSFTRHLHNGDPLTARTVQVPAGRPRHGSPPFTWEASATDALKLDRLHLINDWSLPALLYRIERYNGWGYRKFHPEVLSPYLWSFSNHYIRGKYVADGRFSDTAVSHQCGAVVLLRRMAERAIIELEAVPEAAAPLVRFSADGAIPFGEDVQIFLNQFPGIFLRIDGWPGQKTSDAFQLVTGHFLHGDPRGDEI